MCLQKIFYENVFYLSIILSDAKDGALNEYICSTYLINCPTDQSEFDKDTLDEARQAARKRFRKKLTQLEQLRFFQMREMKNEISGLKAQLAELEKKCEALQKAQPEKGKSLKRKRQTFENAPKVGKSRMSLSERP